MYSIGQENRAKELGVSVIEMLGEPAVLSTGTLFKAAFIPGVVLALLYALYAFAYAMFKPSAAPAVQLVEKDQKAFDVLQHYRGGAKTITLLIIGALFGIVSSQIPGATDAGPIAHGTMVVLLLFGLVFLLTLVLQPNFAKRPILVGVLGLGLFVVAEILFVTQDTSPGQRFLIYTLPTLLILYGAKVAINRLQIIDVIRVVSPPVILIVSVLGSILGGITSPTPAAALGAAGAIMLAAARMSQGDRGAVRIIIWSSFAIIILLLMRGNFDLRMTLDDISTENQIAIWVTTVAYHVAIFGLLYSCWVLFNKNILPSVVRETTKVTNMVFMILIASLLLSLSIRSYGGEEYIQHVLRSFEDPRQLLLVVMAVLFVLGFVLDFIEIIFIVIPIVGPVIYAADPAMMPPEWITILIAVNLQTSFITPPFGFALFYLRGVAPPSVTTADIYRGIWPFVIIQVIGLIILWNFPVITTFLPDLLPEN